MKLKLIFLSLIITMSLLAQKAAEGETYFNNKQYAKAQLVYKGLLKKRPNDAFYNYRYARCSYELKDVETAIVHFEMAGTKYPMRDLYLGELYFNSYRFDESVMAYQTYIATLKVTDIKIKELQQKVMKAEKAAKLMTKIEDIAVVDSVVVNKTDFLRFYKFGTELGTLKVEPLKLNSKKKVDKIKFTTQRQDRIYYSDSIKGHMDLFTSYKLMDKWSDPLPVSNLINTPANENYPFLLLDGVTIYFASDGENSIGGYDLFISRYTPSGDSFLVPENIGMPFNSPFNDYMMVIDEQLKRGWFATDRNQPAGKVMIYTFVPNELKTIIRTEDKNYLRDAARLKTYRKVIAALPDSSIASSDQLQDSEKQIDFVINDSIVYTHVTQFKSEEAVTLYTELHKMTLEVKTQKKQLEDLQIQFSNAVTEQERTTLGTSILELEKKVMDLEKQLKGKTIQVRNSEIKYLQSH